MITSKIIDLSLKDVPIEFRFNIFRNCLNEAIMNKLPDIEQRIFLKYGFNSRTISQYNIKTKYLETVLSETIHLMKKFNEWWVKPLCKINLQLE